MNKEPNVDEISIDEILDFIADQNSCNGCPTTERCSTDDCYIQIKKFMKNE